MQKLTERKFLELFPLFQKGSREVATEILALSRYEALPANTVLQMEGQPCECFRLMISGTKRIFMTSSSGREITLGEVGPGEFCIIMCSCTQCVPAPTPVSPARSALFPPRPW